MGGGAGGSGHRRKQRFEEQRVPEESRWWWEDDALEEDLRKGPDNVLRCARQHAPSLTTKNTAYGTSKYGSDSKPELKIVRNGRRPKLDWHKPEQDTARLKPLQQLWRCYWALGSPWYPSAA
eukprot:768805-Hanusia_phi.AAC.3